MISVSDLRKHGFRFRDFSAPETTYHLSNAILLSHFFFFLVSVTFPVKYLVYFFFSFFFLIHGQDRMINAL